MLSTASAQEQEVATLYSKEGQVEASFSAAAGWQGVESGQSFKAKDRVRTAAQSRAGVRFADGYLLRLGPRTLATVEPRSAVTGQQDIHISEGKGYFFSRTQAQGPTITTPQVSASVRGTELVVEVSGDSTTISLLEGAADVSNAQGSIELHPGEQAYALSGQAPVKRILVRPLDAVQWALYYPAVLSLDDYPDFLATASAQQAAGWQQLKEGNTALARQHFSGTDWHDAMGRSIAAYREGNIVQAARELEQQKQGGGSGYQLYHASLNLAAGDTAEVLPLIERAQLVLQLAPADARPALAAGIASIKAVVAVVQNKVKEADHWAAEAQAANPNSSSTALARSFVLQAMTDVAKARDEVAKAAEADPRNSLLLTRLAELELSFGETAAARSALSRTLELDPQNAYALTIRGFAELTALDADAAQATFASAIAHSPGSGLPFLGLGLALIRQGHLDEGRQQLERAVNLEPNVSLYRSYLGKAFFDEDQYKNSGREYARATELDPNDPTPFLYRSYLNLADHQPIQALQDIQQSIDRNDNRAVFRSRFLLDQDVGVRSASLGKIYNRLGFTELARVEALKALSRDYSNYSAHFLLADVYQNTHLNERAQVAENLIGRLLVPVNFNSNALNIGGDAGLNEYTTLFDRPEERVSAEGFGDSQVEGAGWRGDYTSANNKVGYDVGYAGSYRDGFRKNDWQRTHQLFTLGQAAVGTPGVFVWDGALSVQDQGDTIVNFDPHSENEGFKSEFDGALIRGGYRHRFAPGVNLLTQTFYSYGNFDGKDRDAAGRLGFVNVTDGGQPVAPEPFPFDGLTNESTKIDQHLTRSDLQLIWDTNLVSVIAGTSGRYERLNASEDATVSSGGSEPSLGFLNGLALESDSKIDQIDHREFVYTSWHVTSWADVELGGAYEYIDLSTNGFQPPYTDDSFKNDQFSPKAGLLLQPLPGTAIRFSYSQTLDRTDRGGIGPLEPTYVGGFNQVFDGVRGSEQDLYGVGIDQKFTDSTFAGVSYQRRVLDLNLPFIEGGLDIERGDLATQQAFREGMLAGGADIDRVRAYLYQILTERMTVAMRYDYELFNEEDPFPASKTDRGELQLGYYLPSGWFSFARGTYRAQDIAGAQLLRDTNEFFVVDAGLGYEFDRRHGAVSLTFLNLLDEDFKYAAITDEERLVPRFGARLDLRLSF